MKGHSVPVQKQSNCLYKREKFKRGDGFGERISSQERWRLDNEKIACTQTRVVIHICAQATFE